MTFPAFIFLWRGVAAGLGSYADWQWADTSALAASYGVDLSTAERRATSVAEGDNFMSQPCLKSLLQEEEGGGEAENIVRFKELISTELPTLTKDLDAGVPVDFETLAGIIDLEWPDLLTGAAADDPAASQVLRATGQCGIPWEELEKLAAACSASQLPPIGSLPLKDDFTAPGNTLRYPSGLVPFLQIARLRIHAALACREPGLAMGVLKIMRRLGDASAGRPSLIDTMTANHTTMQMLAGVKAGVHLKSWHPEHWLWLTGWAGTFDGVRLLAKAWESEIYFGIRAARHLSRFPDSEDIMFNHFREVMGSDLLNDAWSETCLPFGEPSLRPFRGMSAMLYRSAPRGAFVLWQARAIRRICQDQLRPLAEEGLFSYAWPEPPRVAESKIVSENGIGVSLMKTASHLRLLMLSNALRLWHQQHGDFPEALDAVHKGSAPHASGDLFKAKPFGYRRVSSSAYQLYSVGPDLTDDGGAPMIDAKGDICWHLTVTSP